MSSFSLDTKMYTCFRQCRLYFPWPLSVCAVNVGSDIWVQSVSECTFFTLPTHMQRRRQREFLCVISISNASCSRKESCEPVRRCACVQCGTCVGVCCGCALCVHCIAYVVCCVCGVFGVCVLCCGVCIVWYMCGMVCCMCVWCV